MLALQAARIFSGGACLGAKTGRPRAELHRQNVGVERFVAIEAGEFDLGGRRQPQVRALEMKHIRRKFGQLAHADQCRGVHEEGRKNFRVSIGRVGIEKKACQRALHPRAEASIERKPRAGNFRGALEIEDSGAFRDFPMRPRREIKLRRRAPAAHFDVCRGVMSHRHRTVRHVGHRQHKVREFRVQDGDAFVGLLDFVGNALHFRQQCGSILARFLAPRNFLAGLVAFGLQPFRGGDSFAALLIERAKTVEINGDAAVLRHALEFVQVFAKISQFMHAERIP